MKRIFALIMALALGAVLLGCGGGGTTSTPDPNNSNQQGQLTSELPQAQIAYSGVHTTSVVSDRLSVFCGGSAGDLENTIARYGYSVEYKNNGWASVVVPDGTDLDSAIENLTKEYNIISVEKVYRINTADSLFATETVKSASFTPLNPYYGGVARAIGGLIGNMGETDTEIGYYTIPGQAQVMDAMGFNGAWDHSDPLNIRGDVAAQDVRVAIIDAGWFDYTTVNHPSLDETILDVDPTTGSGSVAGDGTFTAGLDAAAWDTRAVDLGGTFYDRPYRNTGERLLGIMAANPNSYTPRFLDVDDTGALESDEVWNEGMTGINPNASYILLKTGTQSGESWAFTDQQIAAAINHAATQSNADIIVLGMWVAGATPGVVSTALQTARDNGCLVVAPAGDVVASYNDTAPVYFDETPVDISVPANAVWPGSDANCLSVTGTGYNRVDGLADLDFAPAGPGPEDVANDGTGWYLRLFEPWNDTFASVAGYSNTGGDIAASAYGISFGWHPLFRSGGTGTEGDPNQMLASEMYPLGASAAGLSDNFGSVYATAYVAGAASIIHQAVDFSGSVANPNDMDEAVEAALKDTVSFAPMTGVANNGGFLNANMAMVQAMNGSTLFQPSMSLDGVVVSQPLGGVTRGTAFSFSPSVSNGTAPYTISVNWNTGDPADDIEDVAWTNGDPVELAGGFDRLGPGGFGFSIEDANGAIVGGGIELFVINPLTANITVEDDTGIQIAVNSLQNGAQYRFRSNVANLYTGDIGGTPNTITYSWDFDGDGGEDATGPNPTFTYSAAGNYEIELTITESARVNDSPYTLDVLVN